MSADSTGRLGRPRPTVMEILSSASGRPPEGTRPGPPVPVGRRGVVLVVDDFETNVRLLRRLLEMDDFAVLGATNGRDAVSLTLTAAIDLVLMDVRMPELDGFAACRQIKDHAATRLLPVILMTGADTPGDRLDAIHAGADDFVTKPVDRAELQARVRSLVRLKRYTDELDSAEATIRSLGLTVEARNPYTHGHCQRLASYGVALGRHLGLADEELWALYNGGYLHDLGKIATPDAILLKAGPLTAAEEAQMREHTVVGDRLCSELRAFQRVRPIVRHHHERLDGSGYPDGLAGSHVPLLAQIVSIVDAFDALTTDRPYRPAQPAEVALALLDDEVRLGWRDRTLVGAFTSLVGAGGISAADSTAPRRLWPVREEAP